MNVCLCGSEEAATTLDTLSGIIRNVVNPECFFEYHGIKDFAERLSNPFQTTDIAVLVAADERELDQLAALRDGSDNYDIILILAGSQDRPGLFAKGYALSPRFLTNAASGLGEVGLVLRKMMQVRSSKTPGNERKYE